MLSITNYLLTELLSTVPIQLDKINQDNVDKEILRAAIIGELDAINLYEQMADLTKNINVKKLLLDIAKEEKTHVGELESLLTVIDREQKEESANGDKEVKKLFSENNLEGLINVAKTTSGDSLERGIKNSVKYAFSSEGAKNTAEGLISGIKNVAKKVGKSISDHGIGGSLYNMTHDDESGASIAGKILRTNKSINAEKDNAAFDIAKSLPRLRENNPNLAKQWSEAIKKREKWKY